MSAEFTYPEDGKCYGDLRPLWDLHVEGESPTARSRRHEEAKRICGTCPVPRACIEARDPVRDEGIRGGELFTLPRWGFGGYGSVEGVVRAGWKNKRGGELRTVYVSASRMRVLDELLRDAPTNEVIGKRLFLTVNTVKTHISWLLAATDTRTRTDLALAIKTGRVQIQPLRCDNCGASRGKHYRGCRAKESA